MDPERSTPTTPAPSSGSSSPSSSPSRLVCWGNTITALAGMGLLGSLLYQALPWAMTKYDQGDWKPLLGAAFCVGMLVAPADTLGLVRRLLPRREK